MHTLISPYAGFGDTVHDAQQSFRALLDALSSPGTLARVVAPTERPEALSVAEAALMLTLVDHDAAPWFSRPDVDVAAYCRFHCGVGPVADMRSAQFVFLLGESPLPLERFREGEAETPETAATLIVRVADFTSGPPVTLSGPGIDGERVVAPTLEPAFWAAWQRNHAAFPLGIDVFLACGNQVMGLPRSTRAVPVLE
jgi:alpha-D-ribose 1-methylphosphonate 5-triphosphate synthase subunit PhnH